MIKKYDLSVQIGGYRKDREAAIKRVCQAEWPFRDDDFAFMPAPCGDNLLLEASALGVVYDGEDIGAIVTAIERAVWQANGGMCHVECRASELCEQDGTPVLVPCENPESQAA